MGSDYKKQDCFLSCAFLKTHSSVRLTVRRLLSQKQAADMQNTLRFTQTLDN